MLCKRTNKKKQDIKRMVLFVVKQNKAKGFNYLLPLVALCLKTTKLNIIRKIYNIRYSEDGLMK